MKVYPPLVKTYASRAKKRLGQHFLRDTGVIDRIVRWMQPQPGDWFLEIGAGQGALSSRLAPAVAGLVAVEVDDDCIPGLESALEPFPSATILKADILTLDIPGLFSAGIQPQSRLRAAGNLPYNIATAIIEKLLHCGIRFHDMRFMVQLEVAQRITSDPGSRQYGVLSVHCQHHCSVSMGFRVSASCFVPRPKVSSAMVSIEPKDLFPDPEFEAVFESLVKASFGHRRKTLSNSLQRHARFGPVAQRILSAVGIDGSRRAEELSLAEYEALARVCRDAFGSAATTESP
jgi:16S rRNA (adenine1518-N6/adenine1519-N6)-dimethyltransferase